MSLFWVCSVCKEIITREVIKCPQCGHIFSVSKDGKRFFSKEDAISEKKTLMVAAIRKKEEKIQTEHAEKIAQLKEDGRKRFEEERRIMDAEIDKSRASNKHRHLQKQESIHRDPINTRPAEQSSDINGGVIESTQADKLNNTLNKPTQRSSALKQINLYSLKRWALSVIIAAVMAALLTGMAGAAGSNKPGNLTWTVAWIYLTISAWKYWKWKALLPYPLYLLTYMITGLILSLLNIDYTASLLIRGMAINIGGLITFYVLLTETIRNSDNNKKATSSA